MGAAAPITAYDCVFNREVAGDDALWFTDEVGVAAAVTADERARDERGGRVGDAALRSSTAGTTSVDRLRRTLRQVEPVIGVAAAVGAVAVSAITPVGQTVDTAFGLHVNGIAQSARPRAC